MTSSAHSREDLRHVDFVVVEFPEGSTPFNGDMVAELLRLHDVGLIQVLDLLIIRKEDDGQVRGFEASLVDGLDIWRLAQDLPRVLAAEDVARLAETLEPGTVAGVVVWDNTWARPFFGAARLAGGEPVASGHITLARTSEYSPGGGAGPGTEGEDRPGDPSDWEVLSPVRHRTGVLRGSVVRLPAERRASSRPAFRSLHVVETGDLEGPS